MVSRLGSLLIEVKVLVELHPAIRSLQVDDEEQE